MRSGDDSWYDVAQVCLNGHPINDSSVASPGRNRPYCERCGAKTITACPSCNSNIPGEYNVPGVVAIGFAYHPPAFCGQCGRPFPWTEARLLAAKELVDDQDALSQEEKDQLTATLPDLVADAPMTQVSAGRFRRMAQKLGPAAAESLREILVDVVSETAKKVIWPT